MGSKEQKVVWMVPAAIAWLVFDEKKDEFIVVRAATYSAAKNQLVERR